MNLHEKTKEVFLIDFDNIKFNLIEGDIEPNSSVEIFWIDREETDKGYSFCLPEQETSYDEGDIWLHINQVDNSSGIGEAPDVWIHLHELLTNDLILKIKFTKE